MTPQEALTELKASIEGCGFQCHMETYKMAISALEKNIPKKPADYDGKIKVGFCPECEAVISSDFCDNCGQALDWSDN